MLLTHCLMANSMLQPGHCGTINIFRLSFQYHYRGIGISYDGLRFHSAPVVWNLGLTGQILTLVDIELNWKFYHYSPVEHIVDTSTSIPRLGRLSGTILMNLLLDPHHRCHLPILHHQQKQHGSLQYERRLIQPVSCHRVQHYQTWHPVHTWIIQWWV